MPRSRTTSPDNSKTSLLVTLSEAQDRVGRQLDEGNRLLNAEIRVDAELDQFSIDYQSWRDFTRELLNQIFSTSKIAIEFFHAHPSSLHRTLREKIEDIKSKLNRDLGRLNSIYQRLELFPSYVGGSRKVDDPPNEIVQLLATRFHLVARQLRQRRESRTTLNVSDEYDVQDLLQALLRLYFDDVRPEEWTPSYAGGSSRMDFLLKSNQIVLEVKKTRPGLGAREVGDQLLVDIGRYRSHPDCKTLFCFVYDPDGYITNPTGLENDLSRPVDGMMVKVVISPKGQ